MVHALVGPMLNIRDNRVRAMGRGLADLRGVTMTQVMREALEKEMASLPLEDRILEIGRRCAEAARPGGRVLTKDQIDDMRLG